MNQEEGIKIFHVNRVFLEAIKQMEYRYAEADLKIQFIPPYRIIVHNWSDQKPVCKRFKQNFDKTLDSLNTMKVNQPVKKIERIKAMRKWRKQFEIPGLNIITVKKNYGNTYYLMGCGSQLQLYHVLKNLEVHSYKTYSTNLVKFLYKPVIEALINCKDYKIAIYDKLKVTSTEIRITQAENYNKKRVKLIEFLFQLEQYVSTKILVEKFKEFLAQQFFVCGLMAPEEDAEKLKNLLINIEVSAWNIVRRKKEQMVCIYIICKPFIAREKLYQIFDQYNCIKYVTFLRCVGKGNEHLQPLLLNKDSESLNPGQRYILENFEVKGNYEKLPNEISLIVKKGTVGKRKEAWVTALRMLM